MVLKKLGPATWLSCLTLAWGLVTLGIGFSKNWQTVAACRVLLGICEAVSDGPRYCMPGLWLNHTCRDCFQDAYI